MVPSLNNTLLCLTLMIYQVYKSFETLFRLMMHLSNISSQGAAEMKYYSEDGAVQKENLEYIELPTTLILKRAAPNGATLIP